MSDFFEDDDSPPAPLATIAAAPIVRTQRAGGAYDEFVSAAVNLPPRDPDAMILAARAVGQRLGERAFYSWRQSGGQIEGATIRLAYALAQTWGRCVTRITLVEQDGQRCHLRGVFVDLQQLSIVERDHVAHLAPAPGKFASKPDQVERWNTMQLQSASSKAVRGAILGGLPDWFVLPALQSAFEAARSDLLRGKTLPEAVEAAVVSVCKASGLTREELAAHVGRPTTQWLIDDVVTMRELYQALKDGRTSAEVIREEIARRSAPAPTGRTALGLPEYAPDDTIDARDAEPAHVANGGEE